MSTASDFECAICLEVAKEAVETSCCHHIFCEACIDNVRANCPQCRQHFTVTPSHVARRIIGNMKASCEHGCGVEMQRTALEDHEIVCPKRILTCPAPSCKYSGTTTDFLKHLTENHRRDVLQNVERLFQVQEDNVSKFQRVTLANANNIPSLQGVNFLVPTSANGRDSGNSQPQHRGRRRGATGKFYCTGRLNGLPCRCCDGNCGPNDGCNCVECMRADILEREGHIDGHTLVNRDGHLSKTSEETGKFYCGRRTHDLRGVAGCDGNCGPHDGPNCFACRRLDEQANSRYGALVG